MHAAPFFAQERPLKMHAEDFRAKIAVFELRWNVFGNSLDGAKRVVGGGSDGGCDDRGCAVLSHALRDYAQRLWRAFHDVAPTGAVDVDVNESRNGRGIRRANFYSASRKLKLVALANALDFAVANQDCGVVNFESRSDCLADVEESGCHGLRKYPSEGGGKNKTGARKRAPVRKKPRIKVTLRLPCQCWSA